MDRRVDLTDHHVFNRRPKYPEDKSNLLCSQISKSILNELFTAIPWNLENYNWTEEYFDTHCDRCGKKFDELMPWKLPSEEFPGLCYECRELLIDQHIGYDNHDIMSSWTKPSQPSRFFNLFIDPLIRITSS